MHQEIYYDEIMLGGLVWNSNPNQNRYQTAWERMHRNSTYGIFEIYKKKS